MKVRWLGAAVHDLDQVYEYIAQDKPRAAEGEVLRVIDAVGRLGMHSAMGRPGRVAGTRELVVAPYIVAYRVKSGVVQVLRVLHASRDWADLLRGR